jgi:hypothetical protein
VDGKPLNYVWQSLAEFRLPLEDNPEKAAHTAGRMAERIIHDLSAMIIPFSGADPARPAGALAGSGEALRENKGNSLERLKPALAERFYGAGERASRDELPQPTLVRVFMERADRPAGGSWGFFLIEKGPGQAVPQRSLEIYLYAEGV